MKRTASREERGQGGVAVAVAPVHRKATNERSVPHTNTTTTTTTTTTINATKNALTRPRTRRVFSPLDTRKLCPSRCLIPTPSTPSTLRPDHSPSPSPSPSVLPLRRASRPTRRWRLSTSLKRFKPPPLGSPTKARLRLTARPKRLKRSPPRGPRPGPSRTLLCRPPLSSRKPRPPPYGNLRPKTGTRLNPRHFSNSRLERRRSLNPGRPPRFRRRCRPRRGPRLSARLSRSPGPYRMSIVNLSPGPRPNINPGPRARCPLRPTRGSPAKCLLGPSPGRRLKPRLSPSPGTRRKPPSSQGT